MLATAYVFVRKNVSLFKSLNDSKKQLCFYRGVAMKVTAVPMRFKWYYKQYSHPSCSISSHINSGSLRDCGRRKYDRWCSFHLYTSPFLFSHPWTGVCTTQHYHYRTYTVLELAYDRVSQSFQVEVCIWVRRSGHGCKLLFLVHALHDPDPPWYTHTHTHTHRHSKHASLYVLLQARYMLSYLAAIARLCQDWGGWKSRYNRN